MADVVSIDWGSRIRFVPVKLNAGTTESLPVDLMGWTIAGVISPAGGFAGTITLNASDKLKGTYLPAKDDSGGDLSIAPVAGQYTALSADALVKMRAVRYVKLEYSDPGTDEAITLVTVGI